MRAYPVVRRAGWLFLFVALARFATAEDSGEAKPAAADAVKYQLRYRCQPGETIRWKVEHRARIDSTVSGTTQCAETVSTSIKVWRITAVEPDGRFSFEHSVESVDMWQKLTGRQETRYNSDKDKKPAPEFQDVAKSVGVPLSVVTMDRDGKILKREQKLAQKSAENVGQMTISLPAEAVPVGHVWSFPYDVDLTLKTGEIKKVKTRQQFTLEDVKNGVATISVQTQILTPIHDPALEAQLVQRESTGTVKLDIEAGRIIAQQMDLDKRVVGFAGESSSMHYLTRFTEELLPAETKAAKAGKAAETRRTR
ncbi:MAG: hypothetical protein ACYC35_01285 [Pirellulales bacterium]